jgi:hypothetical protein
MHDFGLLSQKMQSKVTKRTLNTLNENIIPKCSYSLHRNSIPHARQP